MQMLILHYLTDNFFLSLFLQFLPELFIKAQEEKKMYLNVFTLWAQYGMDYLSFSQEKENIKRQIWEDAEELLRDP